MADLKIGNFTIKGNIVLGPMAGITDMPFRALCRKQGASFTYTEMVSAKALLYKNRNTKPLIRVSEEEGQAGLQLFGSDPDIMAEEALKLEEGPYALFDINMGCPVNKVVNNGEGSALMLNPALAEKIISKMAKTLHKPVTVKIRKGFDKDHENAVEIAKMAEGAGAAAITVHGRNREDFYRGKADYDVIGEVKAAVNIPVIGSGDIYSGKDAALMLERSGCDGVMAARGARGNPWIFKNIKDYLETGTENEKPSLDEIKDMIICHTRAEIDFWGENMAIRQMRKHVGWYSAGLRGSAALRRDINEASTFEEFLQILTLWEG